MPVKTEHRITALEERYNSLQADIIEIKTNHLVHLQEGLDRIETRQWWLLGTIVLGIISTIAIQLWK